ncbi:MAG TPA: 50S ribosomal protein L6 [Chlamydiales bacterium]|nr:50S ribosomal protein L6 [Chlamydiales bacterium]
MSRLGRTPIPIPKGVEIKVSQTEVEIKGPKGQLKHALSHGVIAKVQDGLLLVEMTDPNQPEKFYGMHRAQLNNKIVGVSKGFEIKLALVGVGYRAQVAGAKLDLQLGYSHPTLVEIPKEIKVAVDKGTLIMISGTDKQIVGQFAATVRAVKPPEPYKGKGVRYETEVVRKKAGKAAKAAAK